MYGAMGLAPPILEASTNQSIRATLSFLSPFLISFFILFHFYLHCIRSVSGWRSSVVYSMKLEVDTLWNCGTNRKKKRWTKKKLVAGVVVVVSVSQRHRRTDRPISSSTMRVIVWVHNKQQTHTNGTTHTHANRCLLLERQINSRTVRHT